MKRGMDLFMGQRFAHETDQTQVDPCLARRGEEYVVTAHALIASDLDKHALPSIFLLLSL